MNGHIVFQGKTNNGFPIIIRYPKSTDLDAALEYINLLSKEKTYILYQGEIVKVESEKKWLEEQIKKIDENKAILLFVFEGKKLIGISGTELKDKVSSHEGVLGISVLKDYRGKGVGKKLLESNISESNKQLKGLKLITLGVFGNNSLALNIYKKFGFKEYGRLPKGILHQGKYVDHIYMYKEV